jgi:hypothetical protein
MRLACLLALLGLSLVSKRSSSSSALDRHSPTAAFSGQAAVLSGLVAMQAGDEEGAQLRCIWRDCEEEELYSCIGCAYAKDSDNNEPLCGSCWNLVHKPGTSCGGQQEEFMSPRGCGVKSCEAPAAHFCYDCRQHTCGQCCAIIHSASAAHRLIETNPGPAAALKGMQHVYVDAASPCIDM